MRRLIYLLAIAVVAGGWLGSVSAQEVVRTLEKVQTKVAPARAAAASASESTSAGPAKAGDQADDNLLLEGESLYRHQTERDPFTPLVRGAGAQGSDVKVRPGLTGLSRFTVESCILEVILKSTQGTVAWFQGPDGKPYKAIAGEHFADGVVLDISYGDGSVTVQQELNDPTAIKPFRNLVLRIRSQEGEGQ
jgi:Tfp pilus assembly protein PilP